jgi:hypothetical protein
MKSPPNGTIVAFNVCVMVFCDKQGIGNSRRETPTFKSAGRIFTRQIIINERMI